MIHIHLAHQGVANPSHSMMNKGGGGGGGTPYYANMNKLYGEQARAASFMLDQSMPNLPAYTKNSRMMVDEAMDGSLGARARRSAEADANTAYGMANDSNNRNLAMYGAEYNPDRASRTGLANNNAAALGKVNAMNNASQWAEDQKWNRNAGAFGQATGMGTGAMSSLGQAAGGFGSAGNSMMQNDAQNAQGQGAFAGALMSGAVNKFADGGEVRLAAGGDPWASYKRQNPIASNMPAVDSGGEGGSGMLPLAAMMAANTKTGSETINKGLSAVTDGAKAAWNSISPTVATDATVGGTTQGLSLGGSGIGGGAVPTAIEGSAGGTGLTATGSLGAMELAGELGSGVTGATTASTAGTAAAAAGGELAATGGMSSALGAVGTALPWIGAAYGIGSLLDLWADGGPVPHDGDPRKDFRPGGKVSGPGTETSDSIPARLSDGEFVLNAQAVKLIGKKKLEELNNRGLAIRNGKAKAPAKKQGRGLTLKKGGK